MSSLTRNQIALGAALVVAFTLYRVTAIPTVVHSFDNVYTEPAKEYYNRQARALLAGKTSLLERPRPELLALDDPYDPTRNHVFCADGNPMCLHDASLYNGKYYLYFGVTPAVTLFAPFLVLTGQYLPAAAGTMLFSLGALVWSALLLNLLIDRLGLSVGAVARFLLVVTLGCCNCVLYLLRSPFQYEVAITGAQFFAMGGLYLLAQGFAGDQLRRGCIVTGSLLLGLAIGCRPHMGVVALVAFSAVALVLRMRLRSGALSWREIPAVAASLTGPWVVCVALLAAYNYHRFGSFTEFGTRYTLIGGRERLPDLRLLDLRRLPADLFCYLLYPPRAIANFPYVELIYPSESLFPKGNLGRTEIAGSLTGMPFLGFLALAPLTLVRAFRGGRYSFLATVSVLLGAGLFVLLFLACFSAAMRYTVDFAGFFILASFLVIIELDALCQSRPVLQWSLRGVAAAGMVTGCLFNLAISVEGQRRNLDRDFAVRDRLREFFPRLSFIGQPVTLKMQVVFPHQAEADRCEPLLVTGKFGAGDFVYVRYLGDDRITFAFNHWGIPSREGKTVRVVPGRPYTFDAELRISDSRVVCRLDGEEVIAVESPIHHFQRSSLRVGNNEIGGGLFTSETFSGEISQPSVQVPLLRN